MDKNFQGRMPANSTNAFNSKSENRLNDTVNTENGGFFSGKRGKNTLIIAGATLAAVAGIAGIVSFCKKKKSSKKDEEEDDNE